MKTRVAVLLACAGLAYAAPASAQSRAAARTSAPVPSIEFRPFVMGTYQQFAARQTFDAVFSQPQQAFFGGGLDVAFRSGVFIDLTASRFSKTGQRAFFSNGQSFKLGLPLTVTEIPFEVSGGYRFKGTKTIRPYLGAGAGTYGYTETSDSSAAGENVDVRHVGYLLVGGAEVRLQKWVALGADAQWTRISGILGAGGVSKAAGENDLGGVAFRLRVIVGK